MPSDTSRDRALGLVGMIVLEFGAVIAEGPPEIVRQDPRVIAAYLGGGMVATALSDDKLE